MDYPPQGLFGNSEGAFWGCQASYDLTHALSTKFFNFNVIKSMNPSLYDQA